MTDASTFAPPPTAGATAAFLFLQFAKYNVISLLAYGLSVAVLSMLLWNLIGPKLNK